MTIMNNNLRTDDKILESLGAIIKDIRKKRKMSQQGLADTAQIHRNYVISLEKGRQNPSLLVLYSIANALRVKPTKIINLIGKDL